MLCFVLCISLCYLKDVRWFVLCVCACFAVLAIADGDAVVVVVVVRGTDGCILVYMCDFFYVLCDVVSFVLGAFILFWVSINSSFTHLLGRNIPYPFSLFTSLFFSV